MDTDPYSIAKQELQNLIDSGAAGSGANEATTRLQMIDMLLFNCLGWRAKDVVAEDAYGGTYTDYSVGKPATLFILEAKREGVHFELPAGLDARHSLELSTLLEDAGTEAAIKQVLRYCQERGVPIAVVCNGHQLFAFFASRQDGVPPLEGRALVFGSLQTMLDDFQLLWNCLSKNGLSTKALQRVLLRVSPQTTLPEKLSSRIPSYPRFRTRTELDTDLKMLGQLFLQDLESEEAVDEDFVRVRYSRSGALSQYAQVSRNILKARYSSVERVASVRLEPATTKEGLSQRLTEGALSSALSRRPIVLLGDVGVGKSMFLRHLLRVEAKDLLAKSLILSVNFIREPALSTDLKKHIANRMREQLLSDYAVDVRERAFVRAVYNREINQFQRGLEGDLKEADPEGFSRREREMLLELVRDESEHLRRSLEHVRGTSGRSPLVVLDNVDQRPAQFQEEVFTTAHSLAEAWPGVVFVALRPSTFYASHAHGSLAAYQPRVFTVSPARTDDVIVKRLNFARDKVLESSEAGVFPGGLSIEALDLVAYLDALIAAFTSNSILKELIDNLSGGNLRTALLFLYTFIGSGYVSTRRVLDVAGSGRVYHVPIHEFLRAIIFGEHDYFDPKVSAISNVFDISTPDGREHFLLPNLLAHAQRTGESAGRDGYVEAHELYALGQSIGFTQEQIGAQLERAVDKGLVEPRLGGEASHYRVTTIGSYMYRNMVRLFSYVDAMIPDTPVTSAQVRAAIQDVWPILERLDRASIFRKYLDEQWAMLYSPDVEFPFIWSEASSALAGDIARARERATTAVARRDMEAVHAVISGQRSHDIEGGRIP